MRVKRFGIVTHMVIWCAILGGFIAGCSKDDGDLYRVEVRSTLDTPMTVSGYLQRDTVVTGEFVKSFVVKDTYGFSYEAFCEDESNLINIFVYKEGELRLVSSGYSHVKTGMIF